MTWSNNNKHKQFGTIKINEMLHVRTQVHKTKNIKDHTALTEQSNDLVCLWICLNGSPNRSSFEYLPETETSINKSFLNSSLNWSFCFNRILREISWLTFLTLVSVSATNEEEPSFDHRMKVWKYRTNNSNCCQYMIMNTTNYRW